MKNDDKKSSSVPETGPAVTEMTALEWIELQRTIDDLNEPDRETFFQKARRRTIENPIAPLGLIGACGFLVYGLKALRRGDSRTQQLMMRGRVISQAIGISSIMVGLYLMQQKEDRKNIHNVRGKDSGI